ncbi:hypothetical protein [Kitasatospora sp. A2-31]|uniref:hypothetical protein n=1 Tax=Kitasatospora sp. A2-31 TaxID=2916414 RepID=UPI001EEC157B|nr:hypothetical protein [Kitasatospora sp. A2-31]MCG6494418.1 hypothetical protein [Kitasatospora sp. A2-31]
MRNRVGRAVGLVVAAAAVVSGCGGHSATPRTATPTTAPPPPAADAIADCVLSIAPWLQTYLDGGTDLGDYQEMGLSSAQGGALRELQRQAAALRAQGPLPSGWVATEVRRACTAITAARASATAKPTGWP